MDACLYKYAAGQFNMLKPFVIICKHQLKLRVEAWYAGNQYTLYMQFKFRQGSNL